jgi:surfeit locus 1 family protein
MKPVPVLPTLLVAIAVAAMVGLGVWQLDRGEQKKALLGRVEAAEKAPEMAFPVGFAADHETLLFRKAGALCLNPVPQPLTGGVGPGDKAGWRHIVRCGSGAEGPGILVDIGWSSDFRQAPGWEGGPVSGVIAEMPQGSSVIARSLGNQPAAELVLITASPAPGLSPTTPPSRDNIPDNHFAYAMQWFFFAGVALVIYWLAVWRTRR